MTDVGRSGADLLRAVARRLSGRTIRYLGPYPDWASARGAATGYDAEVIADRCLRAALRVRADPPSFERDTVPHRPGELPLPPVVAAALLARTRLAPGAVLDVLDHGGSLGSLYLRCRPWWPLLAPLRWTVVEQPGLVARGRAHLADDVLGFAETLPTVGEPAPGLVVASSVLPYLESPHETLAALAGLGAPVLCLDRTQTAADGIERIFVQRVPPAIYPASYPLRFLDWSRIGRDLAAAGYDLVDEFAAEDGRARSGRHAARYRGAIWLRRATVRR